MNAGTGLGLLETAVLDAVATVCGTSRSTFRRTASVLQALEAADGIGARYAYRVMIDLASPWRLHLPLLEMQGNIGSQHGDPAADAPYTAVRLSPVGALAVAAQRGQVGPVPLGIIEGSLYRAGPVPPFRPGRVVQALRERGSDAGPPSLPTGGSVEGDVAGLLAGRPARLSLGCTATQEHGVPSRGESGDALVITAVPVGVALDALVDSIQQAAHGRSCPLAEVRNETTMRDGVRIVCVLRRGTDPLDAWHWLRSVRMVMVDVECRLPAPMPVRLASWPRGDGSGLSALARLV